MFRIEGTFMVLVMLTLAIIGMPLILFSQNSSTVQATRTLGAEQNNRPDQAGASPASAVMPQDSVAARESREEIRKKAQELYDLAVDLKAETDRTDTDKVLSTTLTKKAQEIEKLAKDIRNRAKG
jgi:hypothetical protein